ncbi:MAG: hypothetical protein M3367_03510 [Acidobacteriota bacterium]|nr:hypothetical protein [Acidobacteriota bacterium]
MTETGEKRLWRVAVYEDSKLMNYDIENVTYEVAVARAKAIQGIDDEDL